MVASCCFHVRGDYVGVVKKFARDYLSEHHRIGDPGSATGSLMKVQFYKYTKSTRDTKTWTVDCTVHVDSVRDDHYRQSIGTRWGLLEHGP